MYALAVHGGAGTLSRAQLSGEREQAYRQGLAAALSAGQAVREARTRYEEARKNERYHL